MAVPPLLALALIGGRLLSIEYARHREISGVRDLARFVGLFSELSRKLVKETEADMWDLVYLGDLPERGAWKANLSAAISSSEAVEEELLATWREMDRSRYSPGTLSEIEQVLDRLAMLDDWRAFALSGGETVTPEIRRDPNYLKLLGPESGVASGQIGQQRWTYLRDESYNGLGRLIDGLVSVTAREAPDPLLMRNILLQVYAIGYYKSAMREGGIVNWYMSEGDLVDGIKTSDLVDVANIQREQSLLLANMMTLLEPEERPPLQNAFDIGRYPLLQRGRETLALHYAEDLTKYRLPAALREEAMVKRTGDVLSCVDELRDEFHERVSNLLASSVWRFGATLAATVLAFLLCLVVMFLIRRDISRTLADAIRTLKRAVEMIVRAAKMLSETSGDLSMGASDQAAGVEELSASIHEIASLSKIRDEEMRQVIGKVRDSDRRVGEANGMVRDLNRIMVEIGKASEETGKILDAIKEFAYETNLLALNASVEAARAGAHGAGFAIVADEVKNLASGSAEAAQSNETLVKRSLDAAREGAEFVEQTVSRLAAVADSSAHSVALLDAMLARETEQTAGIEMVNKAVVAIERKTSLFASRAEEVNASSEELLSGTGALERSMAKLRSLLDGGRRPGRPGSGGSGGS